MTTEKYLKRLCWLANTIQSKAELVAMKRSNATNMVAPTDSDPVQTSAKDTLCEIVSDLIDEDAELSAYVAEYKRIRSQVNTLTGEYSPAYIFRRYEKDQSVKEISSALHVSRTTVYRIREDALAEFEELYGECYAKR